MSGRRRPAAKNRRLIFLAFLSLLFTACGPDFNPPSPTQPPGFDVSETSKIDSLLLDLFLEYQNGGLPAARKYALNTGLLSERDQVRFGLTLTSPGSVGPVSAKLNQMGGEVYLVSGSQLAVAVNLQSFTSYLGTVDKRNFLTELAALKEVREVKVLLKPGLDWSGLDGEVERALNKPGEATTTVNEGVALTGADKWQNAGFKGRGVKIGIIDGGFKNYRSWTGTSLPVSGQLIFHSFLLGGGEGNETHGVAVAEVVHSLAPEASLLLAPIEDEIGFSQAVDWLLENKVQVIQASLGWAGLFPGDGTGKMDEQLEKARRQGVLPVVSVGNYARSHYAAGLNAESNGFQKFGSDGRISLKLTAEGGSAWVALRWDEKWDKPQTNLDLYILDANRQPVGSSRNEQGPASSRPPTELVPFKTSPGQSYYIQVRLAGKASPILPRFHLFAYNATLEESNPDGSVATPGDARGVLSVGAVNWHDDRLEEYSSRGPTTDGRLKPELVGPTRITSQSLGPGNIFSGTSASAPQVSGTAALLWGAAPNFSATQIIQYLDRNAVRLGPSAQLVDPATGVGRIRLGPPEAALRGPVELLGALPAGPPFLDNFNANESGLPDTARGYYGRSTGGLNGYFIRATEPGALNWSSYLQKNFEEFRADFEVTPLTLDPALFYGLIFWQQGPQDYYTFLVSGDRYSLIKRKGSEWSPLINWERDGILAQSLAASQRQRLSVEATAGYIRLRLGETILQSVALAEAQPGGKLGFASGLFPTRAAQSNTDFFAMFSNLTVTPLSTRQF